MGESLKDMEDQVKSSTIVQLRVPKGENTRKGGKKRIFEELLAENFSKLVKDMNSETQEIQHIEQNK